MIALSGNGVHRAYLEEVNQPLINPLILTDKLHTRLADLNEQIQELHQLFVRQIVAAEGANDALNRRSQWEWIKATNCVVSQV